MCSIVIKYLKVTIVYRCIIFVAILHFVSWLYMYLVIMFEGTIFFFHF